MVVIELSFLSGRYHSTPWGRNVNEGVPEWPPSPFRLARALVDVWRRKLPDLPQDRFIEAVRPLSVAPRYWLPVSTTGHFRLWLSSNETSREARQRVFDPFVCVDEPLLLCFDSCPGQEALEDLDRLLGGLAYLGRSESWVQAGRLGDAPIEGKGWNAAPGQCEYLDRSSVVACLLPPIINGEKEWLAALSSHTGDLLAQGRDRPAVLAWVNYTLPRRQEEHSGAQKWTTSRKEVHGALFALSSKVLSLVEETLPLAERIRVYLMGIHKRICGDDPAAVSSRFSGKDEKGAPLTGHRHAFFQPLDMDGDGRLDHLLIRCSDPLNEQEILALDRFRRFWQPGGRPDIDVVLLSLQVPSLVPTRTWLSATPFVTVRHHRKGRGTMEQWLQQELFRECDLHGMPRPVTIEMMETPAGRRPAGWWAFRRDRKNGSPLPGYGFRLEFENPLRGYFSLGALCHFGMGLFIPEKNR